jgi:hypothetical protein
MPAEAGDHLRQLTSVISRSHQWAKIAFGHTTEKKGGQGKPVCMPNPAIRESPK